MLAIILQGFIGRWLSLLEDLKISKPDVIFGEAFAFELAAIRSSLANLRTFPFIREREEEELLGLHGLHFDLASGQLVVLDEASERFEALNAD